MGHYFDVHGYPGTTSALDLSTGLSSVGDALTDVLNRRQKAQQFRDELQFQKEDAQRKFAQNQANDAYQNRIIAERERRDQRQEADRENDRRNTAVNAAMANIKAGHPEMARANIEGTRIYDPASQQYITGSVEQGPAADVGPAPQAPLPAGSVATADTPVEPTRPAGLPPEVAARLKNRIYKSEGTPMPPAFGVDPTQPPIITDDGKPPTMEAMGLDPEFHSFVAEDKADTEAQDRAKAEAEQYAGAKTAFDAASAAYPGERAKYDAARAAAEANRPYIIRFGAQDPGVTVHPDELRTEGRHAAAEDFAASIRGLNLDPRGKSNAALALAELEAGREPKAVLAAFDKAQATGQAFDFKHGENQFHEEQANKRAGMMANGRMALDPKSANFISEIHEREAGGARQDWKTVEDDLEKWGKGVAGLPLQGKSYPRLTMALKNINSGNGPLQRDAQSALVSYFSGGGVVRKFEQEFLLSHLAGLGAQGETAIEHIQTGRLGPTDLAVMQEATRRALAEQKERAAELDDAAKGFGPGSGYDYFGGNIDRWLQTRMAAIGYEHQPLYPGQSAVVLGTTDRPYKHKTPAPRAPGAPPEIRARDRAKASAALDDAMAP